MNEYLIDHLSIKQHLLQLAEKGNKPFSESLNPGVEHVLGVRIPDLRKLARRIAVADWESYLSTVDIYYMEERLLYGLVLGYIRPDADVSAYLQRVTPFVERINSWSVCDSFSFAGGSSYVARHSALFWSYLKRWLTASGEYELRFGIVMAKKYFIDDAHIAELLSVLNGISHEGYYVKMAVAWTLSECFIKQPEPTMALLRNNQLDDFTYNMTLQKIVESYRVDSSVKKHIKTMKRTKNTQ